MRVIAKAWIVAALVALSAQASLACEGRRAIIEDRFIDDSWGWDKGATITIADGAMTMVVPDRFVGTMTLNSSFFIRDAHVCLDFRWPQTLQTGNSTLGITFWAVDFQDFYLFQIATDGNASLWRRAEDRWTRISLIAHAAIRRDAGAVNTLRLTMRGNLATFFINDVRFRDLRGQIPGERSRFGWRVGVPEADGPPETRSFLVTNLRVNAAE